MEKPIKTFPHASPLCVASCRYPATIDCGRGLMARIKTITTDGGVYEICAIGGSEQIIETLMTSTNMSIATSTVPCRADHGKPDARRASSIGIEVD